MMFKILVYQVFRSEALWKQLLERVASVVLRRLREDDLEALRVTELTQCLPTDATRSAELKLTLLRASGDHDAVKLLHALADGMKERRTLGTVRYAIARVLDVAAAVYLSVFCEECNTHMEMGVRNIAVVPHIQRFLDQAFQICIFYIHVLSFQNPQVTKTWPALLFHYTIFFPYIR